MGLAHMKEAYTDLYQFLASRVTGVHLDRDKSGKLRTQVGTSRLADSWRSSDHHGSIYICAVLSRLLKARLETPRPVFKPLLEFFNLTFVTAYLLEGFRCVSNGPQLSQGIDGLSATWECWTVYGYITGYSPARDGVGSLRGLLLTLNQLLCPLLDFLLFLFHLFTRLIVHLATRARPLASCNEIHEPIFVKGR